MQLDARQVMALGEQGWFVAEGLLGQALVSQAREAAAALATAGELKVAGVRRGGDHRLDQAVRSDRIGWIDGEDPASPFHAVWQRFEALREQLNREAFLGLRRFELQLGWYPATGTHYDRHLDAFPGSDNRRVTALVYLNEGWRPEHGGLLRLHVDPPLDVAPTADRCVVFLSERIEHEVLPSFHDRYAIAAWYAR